MKKENARNEGVFKSNERVHFINSQQQQQNTLDINSSATAPSPDISLINLLNRKL